MPTNRSIRAQIDSTDFRTETLLGVEYLVVPVVAMVEGVRFGANQDSPELGLAKHFGEQPITWANKPLVLGHPKVNGQFVSANTPAVLEEYMFGLTMNPTVSKGKLKLEAWIDTTRVESLGGDFAEVLEAIQSGELVEVSVGFFCDLEESSGKFKGQDYSAVWVNIKPDHLAVLSIGDIGACSIEDGCGIPRINQETAMSKELKTQCGGEGNCGCDSCSSKEAVITNESTVDKPTLQRKTTTTSVPTVSKAPVVEIPFEVQAASERTELRSFNKHILAQSVSANLMNTDVSKMISKALSKKFGSYVYLYGYTADNAYYESYNYAQGMYVMYQLGITVTDTSVEFVGEPTEVILQTKVITAQSDIKANSIVENDMSTTAPATTTTPVVNEPTTIVAPTPVSTPAPVAQTAAPTQVTVEEYIAQAPTEIRDFMQKSLKAQADAKQAAIATLKANKGNKFSDEALNSMNLEVLENMIALSAPSFAGTAPASRFPTVNSNNVSNATPAPKVFGPKPAAA